MEKRPSSGMKCKNVFYEVFVLTIHTRTRHFLFGICILAFRARKISECGCDFVAFSAAELLLVGSAVVLPAGRHDPFVAFAAQRCSCEPARKYCVPPSPFSGTMVSFEIHLCKNQWKRASQQTYLADPGNTKFV